MSFPTLNLLQDRNCKTITFYSFTYKLGCPTSAYRPYSRGQRETLVPKPGLEPGTLWFEAIRSNPLSYFGKIGSRVGLVPTSSLAMRVAFPRITTPIRVLDSSVESHLYAYLNCWYGTGDSNPQGSHFLRVDGLRSRLSNPARILVGNEGFEPPTYSV